MRSMRAYSAALGHFLDVVIGCLPPLTTHELVSALAVPLAYCLTPVLGLAGLDIVPFEVPPETEGLFKLRSGAG
jgi:TctA family transporter